MHDDRAGIIHHPPAGLLQPQTQVNVLRAIKNALVKRPDLVQGPAPNDLAGADHIIHGSNRPVVPVGHFHPARQPPGRRQPPGQLIDQSRKAPTRQLHVTLGRGQARPAQPDLGPGVHIADQAVDCPRLDHGVVVQDHDILSSRQGVCPGCEPEQHPGCGSCVSAAPGDRCVAPGDRSGPCEPLSTTITSWSSLTPLGQRGQAGRDLGRRIPGQDDDRDFHAHAARDRDKRRALLAVLIVHLPSVWLTERGRYSR